MNSLSLTYQFKTTKNMSSITTELERETNFVLTDNQDRVVAIINVPINTTDIDNKLMTAISDDTGDEFLYFQTDLHINLEKSAETIQFEAFIIDEDGDKSLESFYLTRTEIY